MKKLTIIALTSLTLSVTASASCPSSEVENCVFGLCVCTPRLPVPIPPLNELPEKFRSDPLKLIINPLGYINSTGIPTQGDFFEAVIKEPDKAIELVTNPGQIPYIPVASSMIAGRNAIVAGQNRKIPESIRQQLRRWYPDDLLSSARYTTDWGPLKTTMQAAQFTFNDSTAAITMLNGIVFRNEQAAADPVLWAHEMYHVQQYREMGVFEFARRWTNNTSVNGPIETPAYAREDEARRVLAATNQAQSSTGYISLPTGNPFVSTLPSGTPLSGCDCWFPVMANTIWADGRCTSGISFPQICMGWCAAGGSPWQQMCR